VLGYLVTWVQYNSLL